MYFSHDLKVYICTCPPSLKLSKNITLEVGSGRLHYLLIVCASCGWPPASTLDRTADGVMLRRTSQRPEGNRSRAAVVGWGGKWKL